MLGCGNIAACHAPAIAANSDVVDFYAVCDLIPEKAAAYQKQYNVPKLYTNYLEMLQDDNIDIVNICTPSGYHAEHAIACAKHGKHVLSEKPLDITLEKVDAMIEAFRAKDLKAGAVFQYRTLPGIQQAKNMLQSGELGKVLIANARYQMYRSPEYYKSAGWRGTWSIDGGGSTMNQGIHILDILCFLAGEVDTVFGKAPTLARDIEVEDVSCATLSFVNGAVGTYQATTLVNPPIDVHAEIICEKGRIAFTDPNVYLYTEQHPQGILLGDLDESAGSGANKPTDISYAGHAYLVRNLAMAIQGKEDVYVPFSKAREAVSVILALYQSHKTGQEIVVSR